MRLVFTGHHTEENKRAMSEAFERLNLSAELYGPVFVYWNPRMRSRGGVAKYNERQIELNARLLTRHPEELLTVFCHELAHILSSDIYGTKGRGHGWRWRSIFKRMGFEPKRCHQMNTDGLKHKRRKYRYSCSCRTYELGVIRHRKIQRGSRYRCSKCKKQLTAA